MKDRQAELTRMRRLLVQAQTSLQFRDSKLAELEADLHRARQLAVQLRAEQAAALDRALVLAGALRMLCGWITEDHKALAKHPLVRQAYEKLQPWTTAQVAGEVPPPDQRPVADLDEHLLAGGLSVRTLKVLDRQNIYYVGQLKATTQEAVLRWMHCSRRTLDEIHRALRAAGYLADDEELPHDRKPA